VVVAVGEPSDRPEQPAGEAIERTLADIAAGLVEVGVQRLVVAGGETSGAVVARLGLAVLTVGTEIAPGVPIVAASAPVELRLALKSGNFGGDDFFEVALDALASPPASERAP
jgi:uncharacterized protein YgbK (DUF1537 family)